MREVPLPAAVHADAQEGRLLWDRLCRELCEHDLSVPPALSVMGRNDLISHARNVLPSEAYTRFVQYADELCLSMQVASDVAFPPQIPGRPPHMHQAEELAWAFLEEGRGSLWHAVRALAEYLPLHGPKRRSALSPHLAFAAGAYGHHGYVGLHHYTTLMPRVCRLVNRFILSICPEHRWTSFQILCDSPLGVHVDSQNARLDSFIIGVSYFDNGQVWVQDHGGVDFEDVNGRMVPGITLDICCRGYLLPTHTKLHGSRSWQRGNRFVLISYAIGAFRQVCPEQKLELQGLGFLLPTEETSSSSSLT